MCRQYGQDSETAMEKEEILLKKRIQDLARTAYQRDYVTFSDFLDLNEQNIVHSLKPEELGASVRFFGGYEGAERQIAAFLPDALSYEADIPYPLACLRIEPLSRKFSEPLTHRDYLGALVHLGIERAMLGDILVRQQEAYVFCHSRMREFLEENVTRIRHTSVIVQQITQAEDLPRPQFQSIRGTVASVRLDSVIALAFSSSRSGMLGLIEGGKVFVNGRLTVSNGHPLKNGDVVSVRGYGKFRFEEALGTTKKGRCSILISRYV